MEKELNLKAQESVNETEVVTGSSSQFYKLLKDIKKDDNFDDDDFSSTFMYL